MLFILQPRWLRPHQFIQGPHSSLSFAFLDPDGTYTRHMAKAHLAIFSKKITFKKWLARPFTSMPLLPQIWPPRVMLWAPQRCPLLPHMWRQPPCCRPPHKMQARLGTYLRRCVQLHNYLPQLQTGWTLCKRPALPSVGGFQSASPKHSHALCPPTQPPSLMASVSLVFVNMCHCNAAMYSLLNSNTQADIILVQEPWHGKIGMACSDVDPKGVDILGGAANPMWDCIYPRTKLGKRCKVIAYHYISLSHFNITN
jgi:hypothetical protein